MFFRIHLQGHGYFPVPVVWGGPGESNPGSIFQPDGLTPPSLVVLSCSALISDICWETDTVGPLYDSSGSCYHSLSVGEGFV